MKSRAPPIQLQDFQRISNAAAGMILAESGRLIGKCVLFGIMGEQLLRQRYKIKGARAVVGAFSICVAPTKIMAFAGHDGTTDNRQNFHCWVEADGFVFDFSSFLYPILAREHFGVACPVLMFQKPATQVLKTMDSLEKPGDFCCLEDHSLREITIDATLRVPAVQDILDILVEWYQPPPKKMQVIGVAKGNRNPDPVSIHNAVLQGAC